MTELNLVRRIAEPIAIAVAAFVAFAGGLTLMNIRADWALVFGALICIAVPILAGVRLWSLLKEQRNR